MAKSLYSVHPSIAYTRKIIENLKARTGRSIDEWIAFVKKSGPKTEAELKAFDENKFFDELREKQPYLFGETVRPVTTGTGGKEPPAPTPGTVHKSSATNGQVDVKKMNRQEFDAHLQKMGLRPTSHIV